MNSVLIECTDCGHPDIFTTEQDFVCVECGGTIGHIIPDDALTEGE